MEGNKDAAEECINIAEKFIREGNRDDAEKYLLKSERLYSTQKAKDLLESLQKLKTASNPGKKESSTGKETSAKTGMKKETTMPELEYTKEQLEAVKRIKKCKDFYEILGITKEATDSEIKKAYKKLALVLHPDKNRAPGAAEAFKAIGNAVAILTNVEKRKQYDLYGTDEERIRHNTSHGDSYTRGFEADVSPEELFNMFFGTSFPSTGNVYVRRGARWTRRSPEEHSQQQHRDTNNYSILMQMLPLLILIALSMMSSLLVSDPVYSLTQNSKFPVMKTTMSLKVPYYVKENFASTYQGSIRRLEASVEEEFIANLRNACFREKQYRYRRFGPGIEGYARITNSATVESGKTLVGNTSDEISSGDRFRIKGIHVTATSSGYPSVLQVRILDPTDRQHGDSLLWRARSYGDEQLFTKAQGMKTPSCETLSQINIL